MMIAILMMADTWVNVPATPSVPPPLLPIVHSVAPPMADTLPRGPAPAEQVREWVTARDYPVEALRNGQSGVTGFTLAIDARGEVKGCSVTMNSRSPSLDKATCDAAMHRAHFSPALDEHGKPVAGSYSEKVHWVLPAPSRLPMAGTFTASFVVEGDGRVSGCTLQRADGSMAFRQANACPWQVQEGYKDEHGSPVRRKVTVTQSVTIDPAE